MILDVIRSIKPIPYREAYEKQRELHSRRVAGTIPDTLWLLEHPPVFTTGLRRDQSANILIEPHSQGIEIVETERGGEVTYHGPGQLVGYLFISMKEHGFRVKDFVQKIENSFIKYLASQYNITAQSDEKYTGVWLGTQKITAIGIALRQKVTMHGFAFNVNTDLQYFNWIVPCGIKDTTRGVTSLAQVLGRAVDINKVSKDIAHEIRITLGYEPSNIVTTERL